MAAARDVGKKLGTLHLPGHLRTIVVVVDIETRNSGWVSSLVSHADVREVLHSIVYRESN
jgi:hypothetical protein